MPNQQTSMENQEVTGVEAGTNAHATPLKLSKPRQTHGFSKLKKAVKTLGSRAIDRRTTLGRALDQWRGDLTADLGGLAQVSTQQKSLIDLCVRTKLLLDSLDTWLLEQQSLVNVRKRSVIPALVSRTQLSDSLARYLAMLGLEKRLKPTKTISQLLSEPSKSEAAQPEPSDLTSTGSPEPPAV
jgi:hypothetical protein